MPGDYGGPRPGGRRGCRHGGERDGHGYWLVTRKGRVLAFGMQVSGSAVGRGRMTPGHSRAGEGAGYYHRRSDGTVVPSVGPPSGAAPRNTPRRARRGYGDGLSANSGPAFRKPFASEEPSGQVGAPSELAASIVRSPTDASRDRGGPGRSGRSGRSPELVHLGAFEWGHRPGLVAACPRCPRPNRHPVQSTY